MTEQQEQQFENDFDTFIQRPEWVAFTSQQALDLLVERTRERVTASGGYSSVSAFEITFRQLVQSGEIQKLRPVPDLREEVEQKFTLTADEYRRMPTRVIQLKYQSDPEFKVAVDLLFAEGRV